MAGSKREKRPAYPPRGAPRPWRVDPVEMPGGTWLAYLIDGAGRPIAGLLAIPVEAAEMIAAAANRD
jgi:hypothetical protein